MNEATISNKKNKELEVASKYPNLGTLYSLRISEKSYKILKNFCEDFDIPNMPISEYMHIPVLSSDDFIADVIEKPDLQLLMNDLNLFTHEVDDRIMLMCEGKCTAFSETWNSLNQKYGKQRCDFMEEPIPVFVLSYDLGDVVSDLDIESLEVKLNQYIHPAIVIGDLRTHYLNNDDIDDILDGIAPEL